MELSPEEDRALVERAKEGDLSAFEAIFRKYYPMVYGVSYRLTANEALSEEVAQETFVKVSRSIRGFKGKSSLKTWLYRIGLNTARDQLRRNQRQRRLKDSVEENKVLAQEEQESTGDHTDIVLAALNKLPAKQKEAITLTVYENCSHQEAAEILGCSINTVSWRVFSAKKKLKKILSKSLGLKE